MKQECLSEYDRVIKILGLTFIGMTYMGPDKTAHFLFLVYFLGSVFYQLIWKGEKYYVTLPLIITNFVFSLGIWAVDHFESPNHYFIHLFLSSYLLYSATFLKDNQEQFEQGMRGFLIILMFWATIQKLASPEFMAGEFFGFRLLTGGFFTNFLKNDWFRAVFPTYAKITYDNSLHLEKQFAQLLPSFHLREVFSNLHLWAISFSWIVVLAEALATIGIFLKTGRKVFLWSMNVTIFGAAVMTSEFSFMSILCLLTAYARSDLGMRWKNFYLLLALAFFILRLDYKLAPLPYLPPYMALYFLPFIYLLFPRHIFWSCQKVPTDL